MNTWQKHMSEKTTEELQDIIKNHTQEYNPEVIEYIRELLIKCNAEVPVINSQKTDNTIKDTKEKTQYYRKWGIFGIVASIVAMLIFFPRCEKILDSKNQFSILALILPVLLLFMGIYQTIFNRKSVLIEKIANFLMLHNEKDDSKK